MKLNTHIQIDYLLNLNISSEIEIKSVY